MTAILLAPRPLLSTINFQRAPPNPSPREPGPRGASPTHRSRHDASESLPARRAVGYSHFDGRSHRQEPEAGSPPRQRRAAYGQRRGERHAGRQLRRWAPAHCGRERGLLRRHRRQVPHDSARLSRPERRTGYPAHALPLCVLSHGRRACWYRPLLCQCLAARAGRSGLSHCGNEPRAERGPGPRCSHRASVRKRGPRRRARRLSSSRFPASSHRMPNSRPRSPPSPPETTPPFRRTAR